MFEIFANTHKIIANNIYDNVYENYDIKLDKDSLLWGSVAPDVLPQLKIHRHYQKESLDYVVNEIVKLIFLGRYLDISKDTITMKYFSKKIGIISHFLSDFVCLPHAERWTFTDSMFKHISYESKLNEYAREYRFKENVILVDDIDIFQDKKINLKKLAKLYIEDVVKEYSFKKGFESDLNYSFSLCQNLSCFIIDTINIYSEATKRKFAFEF